jgi:hypothetical protein
MRKLWCWLVLMGVAHSAHAAVVVDGRLDEREWADAQVFDQFVVTQPYTLAPPSYPTQARLISTPEGIAVGFRVAQPAGVERLRAKTARDADNIGDRVNFFIDFNADGVVAYDFTVALAGSVQDATLTNENQYSTDWDGDWQSAVYAEVDQWFVEMLIPWSTASMSGNSTPTRTVAVLFDRVLGSTSERSAFPGENFSRQRYVSNFHRIEIAQYRASEFRVFPYVSAQHDFIDDAHDFKTGLDLLWKPSGDFQLAAALNPDFGQVEADELVVNFDAIETFFSDRRPFFTENQGFFDLRTPNDGLLIYTRRIGGPADDASGAAAEIDAALKVIGSAGDLKYGALTALESDYADDLGRAFYAQRLTYPIGEATVGYLSTWSDRPQRDRVAMVHAVDLNWRPDATVSLEAQWLQSDIDLGPRTQRDSGEWFRLDLTPPGPWRHQLEVTHFGTALDFNDLGFQPRASFNELEWTTNYTKADFAAESAVQNMVWHIEPQIRFNDEGDRLPNVLFVVSDTTLRNGSIATAELRYQAAGVDDLISRGNGDVRLSPRPWWYFNWQTPRRGDWQWSAGAWWLREGLHDTALEAQFDATYYVNDELSINAFARPRWSDDWLIWQRDNLLASFERDQFVGGANLNWLPAENHELRAKLQWFAIDAERATPYRIGPGGRLTRSMDLVDDFTVNNFGLQVRYRWTFAPQSDFYAVYSRGGFAVDEHDQDDLVDLLADSVSLRDADQVLFKVRYRF